MLNLKKIAITGGVASGKTSVCRFFQQLGAFVVNADQLVHDLLETDANLVQQITQLFGSKVLQNGKIDRSLIAEKVFNYPEQLQKLEELIHPAVLRKIDECYSQAKRAGKYTAFVVEIPLLFEIQAESDYDVIVAVLADEQVAEQRFEQAGFQPSEYTRRMKRQINPHLKANRANYIIHNNGSLEDLHQKVVELNQIIQNT